MTVMCIVNCSECALLLCGIRVAAHVTHRRTVMRYMANELYTRMQVIYTMKTKVQPENNKKKNNALRALLCHI